MSTSAILTFLPLLLTLVVAAPASIWHVSILQSPAPPPDEGPPLSAGALRDKSKLKYEIIGIAASYLVWILVSLFLVIFVGKRLRRRAQTSNGTLSMEMMKTATISTAPVDVEPALKSPGKMASLKSWATGGRGHAYKQSDVTVSSVDEKIIDRDRARNLDEMTNIYAAVLAHDEERSQRARSSNQTSPTLASPRSPNFSRPTPVMPTPPISPQQPPEFQHLRAAAAQALVQADGFNHPLGPTLPDDHSTSTSRASTRVKASPLSFISGNKHHRSDSSNSSRLRPGRISVRGMPISPPMGSADLTQSSQYAEDTPLSPRLYNPGPPPPAPGQQKSAAVQGREVEGTRRRTPGELLLSSRTPANSSDNSLPFRDLYQDGMMTAPPTKTTFLTKGSAMVHPRTGVPHTPYSPYTPFTPMTPITPRLLTKKEMKKQKKTEGLKVLSEDDIVMSDEDMWGTT